MSVYIDLSVLIIQSNVSFLLEILYDARFPNILYYSCQSTTAYDNKNLNQGFELHKTIKIFLTRSWGSLTGSKRFLTASWRSLLKS